jgi:peroxiredoxin
MPSQTDKTLAQIRTELLTTFSAANWVSYSHLVGWLRDTDASHALKVGDTAPDFLLPDADGHLHSSEQLRRNGPLFLSFFRGGFFCAAELCALQAAKDEFESFGATLAFVTPETMDFPRQLKRSLGLDLKVLSDIDYGVGASYGVLFRVPDETKAHYFRASVRPGPPHRTGCRPFPRLT